MNAIARGALRVAPLALLMLAAVVSAPTAADAQSRQPPEQRPDSQRPRQPPPPRRGGFPGSLPGEDWPEPSPSTPPPPSNPTRQPSTALDSAIERMSQRIADRERRMRTSAVPPYDMDKLFEIAAEYQRQYELMRERLFVGDPGSKTANGKAVESLLARWGTLAPKIWAGNRSAGRISAEEWSAVRDVVRQAQCPLGATIPDRVPDGILPGDAWACVSDTFFAELAKVEAGVNDTLFTARRDSLKALGETLTRLREWRTATSARRQASPQNDELRRQLGAHLDSIWLAGARARLAELQRIRGASKDSPFRKFAALAPSVVSPSEGSAPALLVPANRNLRATVGSTRTTVRVKPSVASDDDVLFARQLHEIHYKIVTAQQFVEAGDRDRLRDFADQYALDLASDPGVTEPRADPRFRAAVVQKQQTLRDERPGRVKKEQEDQQGKRSALLRRIADR